MPSGPKRRISKKIERAREVLSHGGKVPVTVEVLMKAIDELLERRDPMRRAERAMAKNGAMALEPAGHPVPSFRPGANRPTIPASVRHQVMMPMPQSAPG